MVKNRLWTKRQKHELMKGLDEHMVKVNVDDEGNETIEKYYPPLKVLKQLIASNFGRIKNDPAKLRKAVVEYVELVGLKDGQRKDLKVVKDSRALSQIAS